MKRWPPIPEFPRNAFSGTAGSYADFRPQYPQSLFDGVLSRTPKSGEPRLLDLGCGPGRVALAIAAHFHETWAVDPELEMLDEGRRRTPTHLKNRVRWIHSLAEDLVADESSFDLVTIGEAFHRMDQRTVAQQVLHWLAPGGIIALLWYEHIWHGQEPWKRRLTEVLSRYKKASSGKTGGANMEVFMTFEEVLEATGFLDVQRSQYSENRTWNIGQLTGYLSSVSVCSPVVLGERREDFEADVEKALLMIDCRGVYPEKATFGCIAGRKKVE